MNRGALWVTVHGLEKSQTGVSVYTHTCTISAEFRTEPYPLVCVYYWPLESPLHSPLIFSIIMHIISVSKSIFSVCIIIIPYRR